MGNLVKLDDILTQLELAQEKAITISAELEEDYFSGESTDDLMLKVNYKISAIKAQIALDYLCQIQSLTAMLRELTDQEFQKAREKTV